MLNASRKCARNRNYKNFVLRYNGELITVNELLALLKEQEPRVMTLEELEDWDGAVFFELYETDMYYALIEDVELTAGMNGTYIFVNVEPGEHHRRAWDGKQYASIWRVWTSRPTDEVRRATPWN